MITLLLTLLPLAFAGDKDKDNDKAGDQGKNDNAPSVKMSGTLFGYWTMNLSDGADNYNEFGLGRAYVRADATINDHFGARVTLDADRFKPLSLSDGSSATTDTKFRVFVKHAYLEWKDPAPGVKIRFGMLETPYGTYMDEFWGHRYVTDNFMAWAVSLPTADLGVSAVGEHGHGLLNWNAAIVNGEGYSKPEVDKGKMFAGRLSVNPLANNDDMKLPITGYVSYNMATDSNGDAANTMDAVGAVGFDMKYLNVLGQFAITKTGDVSGQGFSVSLDPRVPKVGGVIVRYDSYDPDTATDLDGKSQLIAGVDHNFAPKVALALTYESQMTEAAPDTPTKGIFLHMLAGF